MSRDREIQIISFTRGVPPPEAYPTRQLQECATAVLEGEGSVLLQCHPAAGFIPLREWLGKGRDILSGPMFPP